MGFSIRARPPSCFLPLDGGLHQNPRVLAVGDGPVLLSGGRRGVAAVGVAVAEALPALLSSVRRVAPSLRRRLSRAPGPRRVGLPLLPRPQPLRLLRPFPFDPRLLQLALLAQDLLQVLRDELRGSVQELVVDAKSKLLQLRSVHLDRIHRCVVRHVDPSRARRRPGLERRLGERQPPPAHAKVRPPEARLGHRLGARGEEMVRGIADQREAKRGELGDDRHARLRVVPLPLVHLPRLVQLVVAVLDRILEERALGEVADEALVVDVDAVDFGVDVRGGARPRPALGLLLLQQDEPLGALGFRDGSGSKLREREAGVALQLGEPMRHGQPRLGL
mmetsp:Transcript_11804/g.45733  ORF Transcript_11804/g.45733 Transcript_11804/m.45733 type:complete len:334 (+) Transcript_11804:1079-2080(+)